MSSVITPELIQNAFDWNSFFTLSEQLANENRTTGPDQSESLIKYSQLNWTRMQRIEKSLELQEETKTALNALQEEYVLLAITESWCGDGAQSLPAIAKMADFSEKLTMKVILRDEYPLVMDQYLTNGTRSIPIVVILKKDSLEQVGVWGPKPQAAMQILADFKANPDMPRDEFYRQLHTWYARNKSIDVQKEFLEFLK